MLYLLWLKRENLCKFNQKCNKVEQDKLVKGKLLHYNLMGLKIKCHVKSLVEH